MSDMVYTAGAVTEETASGLRTRIAALEAELEAERERKEDYREHADELAAKLAAAEARADAYQREAESLRADMRAEQEGILDLRREYGALENETIAAWIARLRRESAEAFVTFVNEQFAWDALARFRAALTAKEVPK